MKSIVHFPVLTANIYTVRTPEATTCFIFDHCFLQIKASKISNDVSRDPSNLWKRSSSDVTFPVDESVSKLIISIRATFNHDGVTLLDGSGRTVPHKLNMNKGKLWIIPNPSKGTWRISVPSNVRGFSYQVKPTNRYSNIRC